MSQQGDPKPFRPPLVKKTNFCRIDRKWVRYELQVHDSDAHDFLKKTFLLELCPRGNNKDVIIIILVHDKVYIPC